VWIFIFSEVLNIEQHSAVNGAHCMIVVYISATYLSAQIHKHCGIEVWLWIKK